MSQSRFACSATALGQSEFVIFARRAQTVVEARWTTRIFKLLSTIMPSVHKIPQGCQYQNYEPQRTRCTIRQFWHFVKLSCTFEQPKDNVKHELLLLLQKNCPPLGQLTRRHRKVSLSRPG